MNTPEEKDNFDRIDPITVKKNFIRQKTIEEVISIVEGMDFIGVESVATPEEVKAYRIAVRDAITKIKSL